MTSDAKLVLETLFTSIWSIFTSWHIPGTEVSPAAMALFLLFAVLGLRFLFRLLGMGGLEPGDISDARSSVRYLRDRFGRTKNPQLPPGKRDGLS